MAAGHSPEEWLEQNVAVIVSGEQVARVIGRLLGTNELGISLAIPLDDGGGEHTETVLFYPWHRVDSLRLAREDEQPS
jgi:hypothetical protein